LRGVQKKEYRSQQAKHLLMEKGPDEVKIKKPDQMARVAHQADRLAKILENAFEGPLPPLRQPINLRIGD
jgi:hypothetical protein